MVGTKTKSKTGQIIAHAILMLGTISVVFPFVWMILTSFKPLSEIYEFSVFPKHWTLDNFKYLLERTYFVRWFGNSVILAVIVTISELFFNSLIAYALAKMKFPGRNLIFILILSTLMVPTEMLVIPWYKLASQFGWIDTYWGIIFPGLMSGFGVFLLRQFMLGIPNDLIDAARIDGMSEFGIFWRVVLPQVKNALSALAVLVFLGNWNAYLWPVIAINSDKLRTLPVGISLFSAADDGQQWTLIMAASTLAVIPVIIVFFIFQRRIIEGISITGMK
jgi:multiple sugar transport system permease protein